MEQLSPILIFIAVVIGLRIAAALILERRNERRIQKNLNRRPLDRNRSSASNISAELIQFITEINPDDYKESSLVHPNGKFYGVLSGNDLIVLRLPAEKHAEAIAAGGERTERREWIKFRYDWGTSASGATNRDTIRNWCWVARQYAGQG